MLVPAFVIAYFYTDQELATTLHTVVFLEANIATNSAGSLPPAADDAFGVDLFASHGLHGRPLGKSSQNLLSHRYNASDNLHTRSTHE